MAWETRMGTDAEMKGYYQFDESTDLSLCDCIVNRIIGLSDELIIHIPNGLVSVKVNAPEYRSALNAHVVGCGTDSLLIYKVRKWSFFGKLLRTMFIVDFDEIEHLFGSGFTIKISEEYFAFKSMYIKGRILNRVGKPTSKELIILLNDIDRVVFTTDKTEVKT